MGKATSKDEASAGGPSIPKEFMSREFDWKAALEHTFGTDETSLDQIRLIIRELEETSETHEQQTKRLAAEAVALLKNLASAGDKHSADLLQRIQRAREEHEFANRVCNHRSHDAADIWLEESLRMGARKMEAARSQREAKLAVQKAEAAGQEAKQMALQEMEAREALRESAADVVEARLEGAHIEAVRAHVKFHGIKALTPPVQPSFSNCLASATKPTPPPLKRKAMPEKKKKVPEFYDLLDVSIDATFEEIKQAYRREALKWHPDKNSENIVAATARFQQVNKAFETLFDPEKRSRYDAGKVETKNKLKKLQGHGWSNLNDEDDAVLSPLGVKFKRQAWQGYILEYGRLGDDPALWKKIPGLGLVFADDDPRAPLEKMKVFWRHLASKAYERRESRQEKWLQDFICSIWKDTPSKWPKALELQGMTKNAQQEWKERRMVYNRRKEKLLMHLEVHEEYLAIPDREAKEVERIKKMHPGTAKRLASSFRFYCD